MQPIPQILVRNFERCSRVLCTESGTLDNLNMSSISTRLIQDVGRFCERYASDFLISWDAVRKQLEPRHITEPHHGPAVILRPSVSIPKASGDRRFSLCPPHRPDARAAML